MAVHPKPTPTPTHLATGAPSLAPTTGTSGTSTALSFDPMGFIASYPLTVPIVLIALWVAAAFGWKRLTLMYNVKGQPLAPLSQSLKNAFKIMLKEDTFPVIIKNQTLAAKVPWLTWKRYWQITLAAFVLIVAVAGRLPLGIGNYFLALDLVLLLAGIGHLRKIFQYRHRILMQMFEVANGEMRYPRGAELNPWGYIQVSDWHDLYSPATTAVMYPAKYRSEDPRNRQAFEINFNGTVSDQHAWSYTWESSNNRVIAEPVPFISEKANYPFPDRSPWDVFPLGIAAAGQVAAWTPSIMPHLLIAGTTGSGKSVTQRTILLHALQSPDWRIVLIDPKMVELSEYRNSPNVLRVATSLADSVQVIEQVEQEMMSRYTRMKDVGGVNHFRSLPEPPPAVLLMVDETFALLSPSGIKSDEGKEQDEMKARIGILIGSIARLGRAAGIHMVLATQRPDAKVLPGEVKALALDTKLPTPTGWTTMGEIQVGDFVLDDAGLPTRVTAATDVMRDHDVYEVEFSDGEKIIADAGHLWVTHDVLYRMSETRAARRRARGQVSRPTRQPLTVNTRTIAETLTYHGKTNHAVPVAASLDLPEQKLPLSPYVLGVWLGDGNSHTTTFTNIDAEVIDEVRGEGFDVWVADPNAAGITWRFVETGTSPNRWAPGAKGHLRELGVLANKHIPAMYLRGSRQQRLDLLHGLMDTDGTTSRRATGATSQLMYSSISEPLARGVLELVRSLGYRPVLNAQPRRDIHGNLVNGANYRITWTAYEPMFRLPRKVAAQHLAPGRSSGRLNYRYIVAARPIATVPVRCIAVDSPTRLYLAGEAMIPTHNSNLDARIAQGRMDSIPSMMTLDSDAATRLPPIKGRAILRMGNDFTEFQAYFLPPEHLPQVLEMSAAIAQGDTSFLDEPEPEAEPVKEPSFKMPKVSFKPGGKIAEWVAKRQAIVAENEQRAGRTPESRAARDASRAAAAATPAPEAPAAPVMSAARTDVSIAEIAAQANGRALTLDFDGEDLFSDAPARRTPLLAEPAIPTPASVAPGDADDEFDVDTAEEVAADEAAMAAFTAGPASVAAPIDFDDDDPFDDGFYGDDGDEVAEYGDPDSAYGYVDDLDDLDDVEEPVMVGSSAPAQSNVAPAAPAASVTVQEVMRRAAERGVPIPASELLAALRAEAYRQQAAATAPVGAPVVREFAAPAAEPVTVAPAAPAPRVIVPLPPDNVIPAPPARRPTRVDAPAPSAPSPAQPTTPAVAPAPSPAPVTAPVAYTAPEASSWSERSDESPIEAPWMPPMPPAPVNPNRSPFATRSPSATPDLAAPAPAAPPAPTPATPGSGPVRPGSSAPTP